MSVAESKEVLRLMASPEFYQEINGLIKSHASLIYLVSAEERRIIEYFRHISIANGCKTYIWDCFNGLLNIINMEKSGLVTSDSADPIEILDHIIKEASEDEKAIFSGGKVDNKMYILLDYHRFLKNCRPEIERRLRTLSRIDSNTIVMFVGPHYETTPALDKDVRVLDFPYPNKEEIKNALYDAVNSVSAKLPDLAKKTRAKEEEIINSVTGLSFTEACGAFSKSICTYRELNIKSILKEKQEVIRKTGILEFFQPEHNINDIGGLGKLVDFLQLRKSAFSAEAREYGVPVPKGLLLCGVPGAGKSLAAKCAASLFEIPLLRLDFGSLFASLVGESERTTRMALQTAELISPCVLWLDECDKGLSGSASSGRTDGGVTSRVIGTLLSWMQEKTKPVFLMCTANNHETIPTEFMRAGRFDEVFFVDLPTQSERVSILEKLLLRKKRVPSEFNLTELSARSDGYTGAELEKAIDTALLAGFQDNRRKITTDDILTALSGFKPLSVLRPEAVEAMRVWADGRCLRANTPDLVPGAIINTVKQLEIE
jgi:SpoVK/Ycf46/Vps4 family AAA+-type ATPase